MKFFYASFMRQARQTRRRFDMDILKCSRTFFVKIPKRLITASAFFTALSMAVSARVEARRGTTCPVGAVDFQMLRFGEIARLQPGRCCPFGLTEGLHSGLKSRFRQTGRWCEVWITPWKATKNDTRRWPKLTELCGFCQLSWAFFFIKNNSQHELLLDILCAKPYQAHSFIPSPDGGIGRRAGFRCLWQQCRGSSSLLPGHQ